MPRSPAKFTQADIARIIRAHRNEGLKVRTRLRPDGTIDFEEIAPTVANEPEEKPVGKEIVL